MDNKFHVFLDGQSWSIDLELGGLLQPFLALPGTYSHAQCPTPIRVDGQDTVAFSSRDQNKRGLIGAISACKSNPGAPPEVLLRPGGLGEFDEDGVMPSCFVPDDSGGILYFTGWNRHPSIRYRLAIGAARISQSGGAASRISRGPILDRSRQDSVWVGQPSVLKLSRDDWWMWYLACDRVIVVDGIPEPAYRVAIAHSSDGLNWSPSGLIAIDYSDDSEAIGRPFVWTYGSRFWMLHSNRRLRGYRNISSQAYRVVLSSSIDGIHWSTVVDPLISPDGARGRATMAEYASVRETETPGDFELYFNGDGFGEDGFFKAQLSLVRNS